MTLRGRQISQILEGGKKKWDHCQSLLDRKMSLRSFGFLKRFSGRFPTSILIARRWNRCSRGFSQVQKTGEEQQCQWSAMPQLKIFRRWICLAQRRGFQFLASQDALEVIVSVSQSVSESVSDSKNRVDWCDPGEWRYLLRTLLTRLW